MSEEDDEAPLWRRLLLNRFVLVPGAIAAAILVWNVYVATHDNGVVEGRVVDARGEPVPDASVALWVLNFTTYVEKERTRTGPDGRFRFDGNASHNIQLAAEKPGVGRSLRVPVRLYFKAQDVTLREPLRLAGG
jgi:Carboxypeptidase regulatory-like domain